jgi:hypothetical protein
MTNLSPREHLNLLLSKLHNPRRLSDGSYQAPCLVHKDNFHAETNGFKTAFKRVGRRVLIDEAEFFACVERVQGGAK